MFFSAQSGRPFSFTFDGGGVFADGSSGNDNALLYIPTGANDPNLAPTSDFVAVQSLVDFLNDIDPDASGIGADCDFEFGQTIARNSCRNDWIFDLDFRLSQEIPGPGNLFDVDDKITLFLDFDNFLNFIDSDANVFRVRGSFVDLVDVDGDGRSEISDFNPDDQEFIGFSSSVWRIQLGVRYEF